MGNIRGKSLVYGVGINDVAAPTQWRENGKLVDCPIYKCWHGMLRRGYDSKWQKRFPSYCGVTVHPDWHRFSNFKDWLSQQPQANWQELCLDKDLLIKGNKVYAPDTCCFLTHIENTVFRPHTSTRLGCTSAEYKRKKPWRAYPTSRTRRRNNQSTYYYSTKEEAEFIAMRESMPIVIEIANVNPHQFIRDAMFRWIADWQGELERLQETLKTASGGGALFEIQGV